MTLKGLSKKLERRFGGAVRCREDEGRLILEGALSNWDEVVEAGRMAAKSAAGGRNTADRLGVVNKVKFTGAEVPPMRVPSLKDTALDGTRPDVLIIGAGVVGCAIARELSRNQLNILLVEKEHDVALQASSRNDGMVHPGIDLHKGQLKQYYNSIGNRMYDEICTQLQVPFVRGGQYLCFHSAWMKPVARLIMPRWSGMNIPVRMVGRKELALVEPGLEPDISFALFFPTAGSVCPYGLTIAYAENAVQNGVHLSLDTVVLDMKCADGRILRVDTNRGAVYPRVVVNAAGVFADAVAEMAGDRFYSIHPRRGTNSILDKKAASQILTIASSFGTFGAKGAHSKGGGLVHTADGNLLVGPDAVETYERENYATNAPGVADTFAKQKQTSPALSQADSITCFTGVRAATYEEDFVVEKGRRTRNLVHAAGIQSPGLTAAPALGVAVAKMAVEILEKGCAVKKNKSFCEERKAIVHSAELSIEERDALIQKNPDYGVIVCRCEEVSRGEILDALRRPVPCDTVDGVKRRVRPGMGRCQGGFCGPQVAELIANEKGVPLSAVQKSGDGSNLVWGSTKEARHDE